MLCCVVARRLCRAAATRRCARCSPGAMECATAAQRQSDRPVAMVAEPGRPAAGAAGECGAGCQSHARKRALAHRTKPRRPRAGRCRPVASARRHGQRGARHHPAPGSGGHHALGQPAGRVGAGCLRRQPARPGRRAGAARRGPGPMARRPRGGGGGDRQPVLRAAGVRETVDDCPVRCRVAHTNLQAGGPEHAGRVQCAGHGRIGARQRRRGQQPRNPATGFVRAGHQGHGCADGMARARAAPETGRRTGRPGAGGLDGHHQRAGAGPGPAPRPVQRRT